MSKFVQVYTLSQQTPMIHFQHGESGVCLRASEVKPKLDRFLLDWCERNKRDVPKEWYVNPDAGHTALNYKMRFTATGTPKFSDEIETKKKKIDEPDSRIRSKICGNEPICKSFFGNMTKNDLNLPNDQYKKMVEETYKETVFYPANKTKITMTVLCFIDGLREAIEAHIVAFFLIHNFGTRQSKGFGSFKILTKNNQKLTYDIQQEIRAHFPHPFYFVQSTLYCSMTSPPYKVQMDAVMNLYRLMKSGVNPLGKPRENYYRAFIYQYMHNLKGGGIANEKAWMKKNEIVPVVQRSNNEALHENFKFDSVHSPAPKYRYVRAVLGLCDHVDYINVIDTKANAPDWSKGKTTVSISHAEIKRFASPIVFKIVDGIIYILPYPVNPAILGKKFTFSSKRTSKRLEISTPDEFDMDDFMMKFKKYIDTIQNGISKSKIVCFRGTLKKVEVNQ